MDKFLGFLQPYAGDPPLPPSQGTHDLGLLCKRQPAALAKDNGVFKCFGFCEPPPTSAEGEKPGYQHHSRICKHSSLGKIRGL